MRSEIRSLTQLIHREEIALILRIEVVKLDQVRSFQLEYDHKSTVFFAFWMESKNLRVLQLDNPGVNNFFFSNSRPHGVQRTHKGNGEKIYYCTTWFPYKQYPSICWSIYFFPWPSFYYFLFSFLFCHFFFLSSFFFSFFSSWTMVSIYRINEPKSNPSIEVKARIDISFKVNGHLLLFVSFPLLSFPSIEVEPLFYTDLFFVFPFSFSLLFFLICLSFSHFLFFLFFVFWSCSSSLF